VATFDYNPITGQLDLVGAGGGTSYINGVVADPTALPVTLGTPALDSVYLCKAGSGLWLINRRPAGLYVRVANNGVAADWTYLGAFPEVNSSANWSLYDGTTPSKELKFDLSGISSSTVRTLTVPDASGEIALQSEAYDFYYATAPSGATGGSGSWTWNIPSWSTMQVITMIGAGGGGGGGRIGASGAVCGGGGGGGSGAYGTFITRITGGDQIEVLVGAGGAGAAARGPAIANGFSGTAGGNTSVRWVTPNITLRHGSAFGAGGGGGGGASSVLGSNGTAGAVGTGTAILGTAGSGATGNTGSLVGNAGGGSNTNSTQGGRAGGSIDATPTAFNGGALLGGSFTDIRESLLLPNLSPRIGTGAKGGNASITADAQAGDNAGGLGGGGGGGGAALSGFLGGAGGNGGDGFVRINCF
jgi:hypothetical protein